MSRLEIYPIGFGIMAGSPSKFRLEVCFIKRNLFIFQGSQVEYGQYTAYQD
jgi:hypothetical protein